jgi:hypothetical protein
MSDYDQIDQGLKGLSRLTASSQASISFDAVWERAGQLQAKHEARQRSAMFAALFAIGLGAGMGVPQTAAFASDVPSITLSGGDLTPSALLHVTR